MLDLWRNFLYYPFVNFVLILYALLGRNLGLAVIVATVIIRLLLFPVVLDQIRSSKKMKSLAPKLKKLKKKYKKNPQELQKAQLELYKKAGHNPLSAFVPIILQLPILAALYSAVRMFVGNPIPRKLAVEILKTEGAEISTFSFLNGIWPFVRDFGDFVGNFEIDRSFLFWDLSKSFVSASSAGVFSLQALPYLVLLLSVIGVQYFVSQVDMGRMKETRSMSEEEENMYKTNMMMMPLLTGVMLSGVPSVILVYWVVQSLVMFAQRRLAAKVIK